MSRQQDDNLSFLYNYYHMFNSKSTLGIKSAMGEVSTEVSLNEDYNGSFYLLTVVHSGRNSYGAGISNADISQVVIGSSMFELSGYYLSKNSFEFGATLNSGR